MMKYNAHNEQDKESIIDMFESAIEYCDYAAEYDVTKVKSDEIIEGYQLAVNDEMVCSVLLSALHEDFYLTVINSFYVYTCKIKDVNEFVLAYLIRNATKPIDSFNISSNFFSKFFSDNAIFMNADSAMWIVSEAVEQDVELTFVNAKLALQKRSKQCNKA